MKHAAALGLLAMTFIGAPARADEASPSMMLTCTGTDIANQQTGSTTTVTTRPGTDPGIGSAQHRAAVVAATTSTSTDTSPTYGLVRVPARMSVSMEGRLVRVRPSANSQPGLGQKKSTDGWYDLTEVAISATQIQGRTEFRPTFGGKYKLTIDRLTGDARFGNFRGVCDKTASGPAERRF